MALVLKIKYIFQQQFCITHYNLSFRLIKLKKALYSTLTILQEWIGQYYTSGIRASITVVNVRNFYELHQNIIRFRFIYIIVRACCPAIQGAWS